MELLKGLSSAAIDSEFHNMAPDSGGSVEWLEYFMEFLLDRLKANENYELVQSYLGLFLTVSFKLLAIVHTLRFQENLLSPTPPQHTHTKLLSIL